MGVTDVRAQYDDNSSTPTVGCQCVATGIVSRLFSVVIAGEENLSGSDEIIVELKSGGSTGDTIFGFSIGREDVQRGNAVINLPEQGILFGDGIWIEADQAGFRYSTITGQAAGTDGLL